LFTPFLQIDGVADNLAAVQIEASTKGHSTAQARLPLKDGGMSFVWRNADVPGCTIEEMKYLRKF
jgi:hypothetical protein